MKNKYRILKIFVVVVLLAFLLNFSLNRFNQKKLNFDKNVKITMKQATPVYFVSEATVKKIVEKNDPSGKVGDIDIPALEKKINAIPAVDSANVYMNLNGKLNIDILQRVPVMRINTGSRDYYVDDKSVEFPLSRNYSYPCMLVSGIVPKSDYPKLGALIKKINEDDFSKKYFVGITKDGADYELLTDEGNYKVEIGDLDNIDFKITGFKTFTEKYLIFQDPMKYAKISVKYNNQIVTTLRNGFHSDADSLLLPKPKVVVPVIKSSEPKVPPKAIEKKTVREKKKVVIKVDKKTQPKKKTEQSKSTKLKK